MGRSILILLAFAASLFVSAAAAGQQNRVFTEDQLDKPLRSTALSEVLRAPFPYHLLKPTFDSQVHRAEILLDTAGKVTRINWSPALPTYPGCELLDTVLYRVPFPKPTVLGKAVHALTNLKIFLCSDSVVSRMVTSGLDSATGLKVPMPDEMTQEDVAAIPLDLNNAVKKMKIPANFKKNGIQGRVVFRVLVDPSGKQIARIIVSSYHLELAKFFDAAMGSVSFTSAKAGGKPVWSWLTMPFDYKIL